MEKGKERKVTKTEKELKEKKNGTSYTETVTAANEKYMETVKKIGTETEKKEGQEKS